MGPRWDQGTIAARALKRNRIFLFGRECPKVNLSFEGVLRASGHGRVREPLEMVTASLMQNMVQIRKKNSYFVTILFFLILRKSYFGALRAESPLRWGHILSLS